jgi:hypothetical protein
MGTAGGLLVLGLGLVIKVGKDTMENFFPYYIAVCGLMLLGLIIFLLTVKENKWAQEMLDDTAKYYPEEAEEDAKAAEKETVEA